MWSKPVLRWCSSGWHWPSKECEGFPWQLAEWSKEYFSWIPVNLFLTSFSMVVCFASILKTYWAFMFPFAFKCCRIILIVTRGWLGAIEVTTNVLWCIKTYWFRYQLEATAFVCKAFAIWASDQPMHIFGCVSTLNDKGWYCRFPKMRNLSLATELRFNRCFLQNAIRVLSPTITGGKLAYFE